MRLIAKRGLFEGPNHEKENTIDQIFLAINKKYDVEIDCWLLDGGLFLGHDQPKDKTSVEFLMSQSGKLWIHCKNDNAFNLLRQINGIKAFKHENEDYAVIKEDEELYKWQHGRLGKSIYQRKGVEKWQKIGVYRDNFKVENILLDFDGVISASKTYNWDAQCLSKDVKDSTWTAIKRMKTAGLKVFIVSGDNWNSSIAYSRDVDFIHTDTLGPNRKLKVLQDKGFDLEKSVYIGDDWYDIELLNAVGLPYCPSDAIDEVKLESQVLKSAGGGNVIADLYEDLIRKGLVERVAPNVG